MPINNRKLTLLVKITLAAPKCDHLGRPLTQARIELGEHEQTNCGRTRHF